MSDKYKTLNFEDNHGDSLLERNKVWSEQKTLQQVERVEVNSVTTELGG